MYDIRAYRIIMMFSSLVYLALMTTAFGASPPKPDNIAIPIISQSSDVSPDGTFFNQFETANGIQYQESGTLKNPGQKDEAASVQGSASWPAQDGTPVRIDWQADENGATFQGAHLPTPPPIPVLIQRALDWLANNPERALDEKKT
ncbi:endocuticle structural glycoprotein SgAbd-2-like isoform X2 [Belonocnema kinseyi]|uniref:endocuticle structural glycoprotein SgAbd-2-like isoform X2 n=1 Tax=Belonocnema kinseyi TaxID=2817044 RepID=UPI00143DE025|nr:endocuticle structural glycoprotein SgAbd-2-like isoform X2 [Belonocnema kinseyi]